MFCAGRASATACVKTSTGPSVGFAYDGNGVKITGLLEGYLVRFFVDADTSTLDRFVVENVSTGGASHDETVSIANAALLATVTITVTDGDGDVASHSEAIGSRVGFQDDGPTAMAALGSGGVTHDETAGLDGDADDTTAPAVAALFAAVANLSADMAAAFAQGGASVIDASGSDYSQDEENDTTLYSLNLSAAGVDSGLDTTDGHSILLYKEDDLVVGRISGGADDGKAAFALAIDASTGVLSLAQYASLWHDDDSDPDDTVKIANSALFATVTDGDSDTHSASVAIGDRVAFQDDDPLAIDPEHGTVANAAGASGTFALDEDLLPASFADNFGQDGPAAAQGRRGVRGHRWQRAAGYRRQRAHLRRRGDHPQRLRHPCPDRLGRRLDGVHHHPG